MYTGIYRSLCVFLWVFVRVNINLWVPMGVCAYLWESISAMGIGPKHP